MQIYDFTVAPNTQRQLDAPGNYFYYYTGSAGGADQTITLRGVSSGLRVILKNGQSLRLSPEQKNETSWYIGNYANTATIIGAVIVGNGEIQDNRIQGTVETIDGELNKSKAGMSFMFGVTSPAVVGQNSYLEIWNPPASGKRTIISDILFSSNAASPPAYVLNKITALTVAATAAQNKYLGKVGSASLFGIGASVAPAGITIELVYVPSTAPLYRQFKQPIILDPGNGISVICFQTNVAMLTSVQFTEEAQ